MQFRVLGPLEVLDGDRRTELGPPKQRAFLAALLVEAGRVVSVDRLADLLWDGEPPDRALVSLRAYASNLRKILEPGRAAKEEPRVLRTVAPGYLLDVADDDVDARVFDRLCNDARAAAAAGDHERACALLDDALALWRGGALADLAGEAFARAEVARLEERRLTAIEDRFESVLALGRHREAIPELEHLATEHPLRERAHALLMLALAHAGRPAEALQVYREMNDRLLDELGLEPGPQLRVVAEQIRAGDVGPVGDVGGIGEVPPADETAPPIVGRDTEVATIEGALRDAAAGRGSIVLVAGDAGIGKTRLLEEIAARAASTGPSPIVTWGRCFEAEDAPPFWPWVQVLRAVLDRVPDERLGALDDRRLDPLVDLLPELALRVPAERADSLRYGEGERVRVFDAVHAFLDRAVAGAPLVAIVDDLHWADAASLQLLAYLAGTLASMPIVVIATYREHEAAGDALVALLAELARVPATRLSLARLDDDAAATLAGSALGEHADAELVADVVRRAEGNPFFVNELVRLAAEEGGLSASVPAGIGEVIRRRLRRLPDGAVTVLVTAAIAGREFDLALLDALSTDVDALDLLEAAVDAGLVVEHASVPGRYRFAHALVQETLLGEVGGLRRARIHAKVAAALETLPASDPDARLAELARHYVAGAAVGPADRAVDVALEAGERAMQRYAYEDAKTLFEQAVEVASMAGVVDERRRGRALVALARALRWTGDSPTSRERSLEAAGIGRRLGDAELLADAGLGLAMPGAAIGMDFGWLDTERVQILEAALDGLPPEPSERRIRSLVHLALALHLDPARMTERKALAREAAAQADELDDAGMRSAALAAHRSTLWTPGDVHERADAARRLVELAEQAGAGQTALDGRIGLAIDLLELGDLDGFDRERTRIDEATTTLRLPFYRWYPQVFEATRAALEGRYADAETAALTAAQADVDALGRRGAWGLLGWRCIVDWDRGRLDDLVAPLRQVVVSFPDMPVLRAALALCLADTGRVDEAVSVAAPLLANSTASVPDDSMCVFTLAVLTEVCARSDDRDGAAAILDRLTPAAGTLVVVGSGIGSTGAVDRSLGVAAAVLGRWEDAESRFRFALERNEAAGAAPWAARTRLDWARMLLARGDPGDKEVAAGMLTDAEATASAIGADGLVAAIAAART